LNPLLHPCILHLNWNIQKIDLFFVCFLYYFYYLFYSIAFQPELDFLLYSRVFDLN
jgi:hypothetical protein